jgi:hypothetical protein
LAKQYYVSVYHNYPIYESAEGGYYYTGTELDEYSNPFNTLVDARKELRLKAEELEYANKYGLNKYVDEDYIRCKYVGEGSFVTIEKVIGSERSGVHTYC